MPKDGRHLGLGELPSPSVLGLVCFPDPRNFRLG